MSYNLQLTSTNVDADCGEDTLKTKGPDMIQVTEGDEGEQEEQELTNDQVSASSVQDSDSEKSETSQPIKSSNKIAEEKAPNLLVANGRSKFINRDDK